MSDLKPCPFCGGNAEIVSDYSSEQGKTLYKVWHSCGDIKGNIKWKYGHSGGIDIDTPWCFEENDAIEAWNRRDG